MWTAVGAQGGKLITTKAKVSKVSSERVVPMFFSSHPDAHDAGTCSKKKERQMTLAHSCLFDAKTGRLR